MLHIKDLILFIFLIFLCVCLVELILEFLKNQSKLGS